MKFLTSFAASVLFTTSAASIISLPRPAAAEECGGPFRECALGVSARCSRDADGQQRMTYSDRGGRVIAFEKCVGRIFEAAGYPNPYKTGVTASGDLSVPITEVTVPHSDP